MANQSKDPHHLREANKYKKPVASREYIIELLSNKGKPMTHPQLARLLKLTDLECVEGLRRRLRAMQRDGQLLCNRRGAYALVAKLKLIAGTVRAHKDGFGFLQRDDQQGKDLFITSTQMRCLFDGDRVLVSEERGDWKGRRGIKIADVIQRNTHSVVGRYTRENGVAFVEPNNKRITHTIFIAEKRRHGAKPGQIVNVKIIRQPEFNHQAMGEVTEILGETMAPGLEIDVALRTYELPNRWSQRLLANVDKFPKEVAEQDKQGREDLRQLPLITIDSEDAKDFDDAIYCEPRKRGGWRLCVAIADVSHYVQANSLLDKEAKKRGNSVYFPGRVIPMLPEALSNGLCSLKPQVDRLCMVCDMRISANGKITQYRFYSAVMRSHARMTYTNVEKILRGDRKLRKQYQAIVPHLQDAYDLYQVLWKTREKRGALDFDNTETKIIFSSHKKIERIVPLTRGDANRLIEEFMLAANVCAAEFVEKQKLPALFRVHPVPSEEKLTDLRSFLHTLGLSLPGGKKVHPKDYAELLRKIRQRDDDYLIQTIMLRALSPAVFAVENKGHFGLAYKAYTHFTSPIRRYPDLLLHRAIRAVTEKQNITQIEPEELHSIAEHCSKTERRADEATRDVTDWLKCEFMQEKLGQDFTGKIASVTSFGVFVCLHDFFVEGLVHITNLKEDYYDFDSIHHRLTGQRTGICYQLGDEIVIKVARVDLDKREIDFEWIASP